MSKRVQLKHILLDVDFFEKPKVLALEYKHTAIAVLVYVKWLTLMSRATNGVVSRESLFGIAKEYFRNLGTLVATPESVLKTCIDTGMIVELDGGYSNERVLKDQEACALKRSESSERQKKYRERAQHTSNALQTRLPVTETVTDTVDDPVLDPKETVTLPDSPEYQKPEVVAALAAWQAYAKKRLRRDFGQIEADALLSCYNTRLPDMVRDITGSIRSGWRNICDCSRLASNGTANHNHTTQKRESNFERNLRIMGGKQ